MKVTASLIALLLLTSFVAGLALPTAAKAGNRCTFDSDCTFAESMYESQRENDEQRRQWEVDDRLHQIEQRQRQLQRDLELESKFGPDF